jgi:protein involved in polysaccharide export with SLBB domain
MALLIILVAISVVCGDTFRIFASETDDYTVGIEDELSVSVFELPELGDTRATVGPDGVVVLPQPIGAIPAAGFTRTEIEGKIREKLSQYFKEGVKVTLQVTQYKSRKIYIFGDGVTVEGAIAFAKTPSFLDVIAKANLAPNADKTNIRIITDEKNMRVNLEQLLEDTEPAWPKLLPGDTIYVPAKSLARPELPKPQTPAGEVPQERTVEAPDAQQVPPAEAGKVIIHVLGQFAQTGSFPFAAPPPLLAVLIQAGLPTTQLNLLKEIKVVRGDRTVWNVDMIKYIATGDATLLPKLQSGDLVYISSEEPPPQQRVTLLGAVNQPGSIPIDQPTNLLDILVKAGGLAQNANSKEIRITREAGISPDLVQMRTVNLEETSFQVQPGDRILIPAQLQQPESIVQRTVGALRDVMLLYSNYILLTRGIRR